jgi:RNA polymerase sigma-70 factor (ECF subfamily)
MRDIGADSRDAHIETVERSILGGKRPLVPHPARRVRFLGLTCPGNPTGFLVRVIIHDGPAAFGTIPTVQLAMAPLQASTQEEIAPSFSVVFEGEFAYVWQTLRRLGVAERDLDDVTHDVFLQVFRHIDVYDPARPLRAWLFGFAFRAASNYRRLSRHRLVLGDAAAETADEHLAADERLIRAEEGAHAEAALAEVELDRRALLILHEIEGRAIPEVAESLGIPLNTAYSRLRLARRDYLAAHKRLALRRGQRR